MKNHIFRELISMSVALKCGFMGGGGHGSTQWGRSRNFFYHILWHCQIGPLAEVCALSAILLMNWDDGKTPGDTLNHPIPFHHTKYNTSQEFIWGRWLDSLRERLGVCWGSGDSSRPWSPLTRPGCKYRGVTATALVACVGFHVSALWDLNLDKLRVSPERFSVRRSVDKDLWRNHLPSAPCSANSPGMCFSFESINYRTRFWLLNSAVEPAF